jgi:hypothetical protein
VGAGVCYITRIDVAEGWPPATRIGKKSQAQSLRLFSSNRRIALYLDLGVGNGQGGDGDQSTAREIVASAAPLPVPGFRQPGNGAADRSVADWLSSFVHGVLERRIHYRLSVFVEFHNPCRSPLHMH